MLNRAAAAVVGAALTGLASGLGLSVSFAIDCIGRVCEDRFGFPLFYGTWGVLVALLLGLAPGFIALTITPARTHPWRALPILSTASAVGFGLFVAAVFALPHVFENGFAVYLLCFLLPTATGLITAFNIRKIPFARA